MKYLIIVFLFIAFKFSFSQVNPINNSISLDISTFPQNTNYTYDSCLAVGKGLELVKLVFSKLTSLKHRRLLIILIYNIANIIILK